MGANAAGATGGCEGGGGEGGSRGGRGVLTATTKAAGTSSSVNETCWNDIAVKTKAVCCIYL